MLTVKKELYMAAIGRKIYDTCCWLAQPITIPTLWVWSSAGYYLGFQKQLMTTEEIAQKILQESKIWHQYAKNYQQSEMWGKVKEHLAQPLFPLEILAMLPLEMRPPIYSWKIGDRKEFWGLFVQKQFNEGLPKPNPHLGQALLNFEKEGKTPGLAIDLGCGAGVGTCELLARGWTVIAVDSSQVVLDMLNH